MAFAMPSFQFLLKSGKSRLTAVIWRIRHVSIFQTLNTRLQQTTKIITFHHLPSLLTVNRIYSQSITPCREGPGGGRKTHLQVESLLPRLSTDFSVIRSNQVWGFRVSAGFRGSGLKSIRTGLICFIQGPMLGDAWSLLGTASQCEYL